MTNVIDKIQDEILKFDKETPKDTKNVVMLMIELTKKYKLTPDDYFIYYEHDKYFTDTEIIFYFKKDQDHNKIKDMKDELETRFDNESLNDPYNKYIQDYDVCIYFDFEKEYFGINVIRSIYHNDEIK